MKRALKKREKAVIENTPNEDAQLEKLNIAGLTSKHRYRTKAAMIGLAISMGATSLLVTRQSDQAQAAEPVGNQNTASPVNDTEVKLAVRNKLESKLVTSVTAAENPSPIILEPTAVLQVPGLGAKWQVASNGTASKNPVPVFTVDGITVNNVNNTSAVKGERINSAIAKVQSNGQPATAVDNVDSQLKAQQELAVNTLKEKSNRLRASLAELRSGETNELSQTTTINPNAENQQPPIIGDNNINPVPEQQKADAESQVTVAAGLKVYEVKSGDTLAAIASNYGTSVSELVKANNLGNPNQLKISQKLNVPILEKGTPVVAPTTDVAAQLKDSNATNDLTAITVPTVPTNVPFSGVGGDTPVPKVFAEIQEATKKGAKNKDLKDDPGLRSLQAEIIRLRQKYRNQQSGSSNSQLLQQTAPSNVVIPVPTYQQNTVSVPTVPKNTRPNNFAVPIVVPRPMAPTYSSQPTNPNWTPSRNSRSVPIPVPTGANASETLSNMRGRSVSPELPPLAAVDRYLPRAVDGNISPTDNPGNPGGVYTPGITTSYIWPAKGVLTSGFGMRWGRQHKGVDVANSTGTPIYAAAPGVVEKAGWNKGGYGNLVEIRHPDGTITRYAHNSKILARQGQQVQQGETIALMGSTGHSTGPHTHFEIRPSGKDAVNPVAFLPNLPNRI